MIEAIQVTSQNELEDAFSIRNKVFVEEQKVPVELEIDEYENSSTHVVLYDGDQPVGAGRIREVENTGKLERICVLSSYRGKGAGTLIMNKLEEIASQNGFKKVKLNSQTHAIPFYEKLGYKVVSDIFMDAGIPHVTMVKTLD